MFRALRAYGTTIGLALIVAASLGLQGHHLGHRAITYWDESFHALVARNLLKHPLKFTLIDQPWLPYDYKDWGGNHIWLHKPPLPMWLIALSYAIFGVSALALRIPSLLLSAGTVALTYQIGKMLFDRRAGLIAAFWIAFNPCLYRLVHGYLFSDHIDVAVLFWVTLACYLLLRGLRTGRTRDYVFSGVAQGLGYLSKSFLGLLPLGIALGMGLLARIRLLPREAVRLRGRHLLFQFIAILITVAPWTIYGWVKYPREFLYETGYVLKHLDSDIESWGATWDRPLFEYMLLVVPVIYSGMLAATILLLARFLRHRPWQDAFLLLWIFGVIVPHTLATTKTPSATAIGLPAFLLAFAVLISRSFEDRTHAAFWLAAVFVLLTFPGGQNQVTGRDQFDDVQAFAPYLKANFWILKRVVGILGLGGGLALMGPIFLRRMSSHRAHLVHWGMLLAALIMTGVLGVRTVREAKAITDVNADDPTYLNLGRVINARFPQNACFFLDAPIGHHQRLMFYADRTVYFKGERDLKADAATVRAKGGIPYLITKTEQPLPLVLDHSQETGYRIYALYASRDSEVPTRNP